jgi:hypothetical protein
MARFVEILGADSLKTDVDSLVVEEDASEH